jgi:hypothetical protein
MPCGKLEKKFEKEYGKKRGKRFFFAWEHKRRGQFTIYAVIVTVITLFIYAAFYPLLMNVISSMALTGMEATLAQLIPFLMLLGIALIPLNYSQPQRYQGQ